MWRTNHPLALYSLLRFGMMWPGAEPTKDVFNETYFTIAKEIVSRSVLESVFVTMVVKIILLTSSGVSSTTSVYY